MLEFIYRGNYPEDMDTECIELCDILNSLPTVKTYESCCGHNKSNYIIFFTVTDWRSISFLARCIDSRYCDWQSNWILYAYNNDTPNQGKFKYLLECKYSGKEDILTQVTNLISNMYSYINDINYIDSFLINLDGFQVAEPLKGDLYYLGHPDIYLKDCCGGNRTFENHFLDLLDNLRYLVNHKKIPTTGDELIRILAQTINDTFDHTKMQFDKTITKYKED